MVSADQAITVSPVGNTHHQGAGPTPRLLYLSSLMWAKGAGRSGATASHPRTRRPGPPEDSFRCPRVLASSPARPGQQLPGPDVRLVCKGYDRPALLVARRG